MRAVLRIMKASLSAVVIVATAGILWMWQFPSEQIRLASNYAAKTVCSNFFLAGRNPQEVLRADVRATGHWLFRFMEVAVDEGEGHVRAGLFGHIGDGLAVVRQGVGCTTVPDHNIEKAIMPVAPLVDSLLHSDEELWPAGSEIVEDLRITAIIEDAELTGEGMRAVVVVKGGLIIGERYGAGFDAEMPLAGWSMTKTVNAAIIGTLVKAGNISLDQTNLFKAWESDERSKIKLADLLGMASGLEFDEGYGSVTDVTRMLYLEPDMAEFAIAKPLVSEPGKSFHYSSGTAVALSRFWQNIYIDPAKALSLPVNALFQPLNMRSAVFETDESGTYAGSSNLYASARDWARFGLFLNQRGVWNGTSLLAPGFVDWMHRPHPASMAPWGEAEYGRGQVWLRGPGRKGEGHLDPDAGYGLPADTFWMLGHDGQSITIIPSEDLVVVRLGLTPIEVGYKPQALVAALIEATR